MAQQALGHLAAGGIMRADEDGTFF
jgi:hypothetical protein